jgi:hypothetical protein
MASKRREPGSPALNPPDLPETLAAAVLRAYEGTFPTPTEEEAQTIPHLFELLTPMMVRDPSHKGKGEPRKVLREPLLMLSWDRLQATWKLAIGDKVLNLSGQVPVRGLLTALADAEAALSAGTFPFKTKKVT